MSSGVTLQVVAIMRNEASGVALDEACENMNGTALEAHVGALKDVRPDVDILRSMDVLLLEVDPKSDGDMALLGELVRDRFPRVPVIGTASDATVQDVRQMMRMGVVDFVPQPFSQSDIDAAINLAMERRSTMAPVVEDSADDRGRIVSFIKGGGGVGATTVAVQTGCVQAQQWRKSERSVVLVDLDIQGGTAALYLDLDNRVGVADLVEAIERLDESVLDAVSMKHPSGLRLIGAPREVMPLDILTAEVVETLLEALSTHFDLVLVDLAPIWDEGSLTALEKSDAIVLVSQLSVAGVRQMKHQLDTLTLQGLGESPVFIALNRYEAGWGKSVHLKEAEKALGRRIDYQIPNDFKLVSEALNQGVAISDVKGKSKVEKALSSMMDDLLLRMENEGVVEQKRSLFGLRKG